MFRQVAPGSFSDCFYYVYVEYENESRDLPWRLSFASEMSKFFSRVFIGYRMELVALALKLNAPGIYVAKDLPPERVDYFRKLKTVGIKAVLLDEEAFAIYQQPEKMEHYRYSVDALSILDVLILSSRSEEVLVRKNLEKLNTRKSGPYIVRRLSPRFSCYFTETNRDIVVGDDYKEGEISVLLPMSMPVFHSAGERERSNQLLRMVESFRLLSDDITSDLSSEKFLSYYETSKNLNLELIKMVSSLTSKCALRVTLRLHPAEDFKRFCTWAQTNFDIENIIIEKPSAPIADSFINKDVVIHASCTSGLEACNFYRIPTINYSNAAGVNNVSVYGVSVGDRSTLEEEINKLRRGQFKQTVATGEFFLKCSSSELAAIVVDLFESDARLNRTPKLDRSFAGLFEMFLRLRSLAYKVFCVSVPRVLGCVEHLRLHRNLFRVLPPRSS